MTRSAAWLGIVVAATVTISSCQPSQRVHASNEDAAVPNERGRGPIHGDLHSVDTAAKTLVIRVDNGMAQTFRWDDSTVVDGNLPPDDPKAPTALFDTAAVMKKMTRRRGSELIVEWRNLNDEKLATAVHIETLYALSKPPRKRRSKATR